MIKLITRYFFDVICVGYNMGSYAYTTLNSCIVIIRSSISYDYFEPNNQTINYKT